MIVNPLRTSSALLLAMLAACVSPTAPEATDLYQSYRVPFRMPSAPQAVVVKVSLGEQRAYITEHGRVLMTMPVTVGGPDNPTPSGSFRITRKIERHRSPVHGFAVRGGEVRRSTAAEVPAGWRFVGMPLPYWCEIAPDVGFHTGWIRHQPASAGTIRMHENIAPVFFSMVAIGTRVDIAYEHPEDQTHGFIPLPPDSGPLPDRPDSFYLADDWFSPR